MHEDAHLEAAYEERFEFEDEPEFEDVDPIFEGPFAGPFGDRHLDPVTGRPVHCAACGEKFRTDANGDEDYTEEKGEFWASDQDMSYGVCHAECGLSRGLEMA